MYIDEIAWCKCQILTVSCLIFLLARLILIVDTAGPRNPSTSRQMCAKLQSMLSFGKYQTSQISSNVTYASRLYAQNFLAYSSIDDLLIFIEPKHQIHVYNAQTIQLLVNLTTTDVVIATSTTSLITDSRHDIYFIYETNSETNLISLRVCQVRFNMFQLIFENIYCIETINIQYDQPDLRINGFTIKRDHAGTKKSLLFISTDIGLIYTVFDTHLGSLIGESTIMNDTLNEGSIVISSSGVIYYASKQEHLIYELYIQRDFRLRHGKIIKTNAIKYPFGLITDECNHLYIATRSMILIMYAQNRATIRSVFSKASDLPITLERLNSTTYVYATIRKQSTKMASHWMFNFLYFTNPERAIPERAIPVNRHPVVNWEENLDNNNTETIIGSIPKLWPLAYESSSSPNATKIYTKFNSTPRKPFSQFRKKKLKKTQTTNSTEQDSSSFDGNKYFTVNPLNEQSVTELSDDFQSISPDGNLEIDDNLDFDPQDQIDQSLENDLTEDETFNPDLFSSNSSKSIIPIDDLQNFAVNQNSSVNTTLIEQTSDSYSTSSPHRTIEIAGTIFSEDEIQSYLAGRGNLTSSQEADIQAYLARQSSSNDNILAKYLKTTNKPRGTFIVDDGIAAEFQTNETSSSNEYIQSEQPSVDSNLNYTRFNHTIDSLETTFPNEDLQSYLEGRGNLSRSQEARIEAYLAKQSSLGYNLFTKSFKTTKKPSHGLSESERDQNSSLSYDSQSQSNANESTSSDSKSLNRTIDIGGTLFSEDEIQSYLEGRRNLTASQEAQIQGYIADQLSSNNTIFSRYSKSTKPVTAIYVSHDTTESTFPDGNNSSQNYSTRRPSFDFNLYPELFDHIIDSNGTLISTDDLQSYLEGRSNLSASQETLIQTYLARQSSSFYNIFSKYSKSTTKPSRLVLPNEKLLTNSSTNGSLALDEDWQLEEYLKYLNRTTNTDEILFSYEDLKSYLRGNTNISVDQETQIQAYLAEQSSSSYNPFSKYSTTTKKPRRISIPGRGIHPDHQRKGNLSLTEDGQMEDYSEELLPTDRTSYNHTTDIDELPFSEDDLQAYIEGRVNLSLTQEAQIQAYLAKQSSSSYNLFSKYSTSTKKPRRTSIPGRGLHPDHQRKGNLSLTEDTQMEDYSEELLPTDRTSYNHTTDIDELPFSEDDLQAYIEGRVNLSLTQEAQIQAYLAKQSSSSYNLFSKYSTSTKKPRRTSIPGRGLHPDHQRKGNLSLTEDTQMEDYSEELLPTDRTSYNHTTDIDELPFSEDDLQAYIEGRVNLSLTQEAQIQAYLAKQSSSSYNLFSKYSTSTKKPRRTSIPGRGLHPDHQRKGNLSLTEDTQMEDYSEELLPTDLTSYNRTIDPDELIFSEDDLRAYLEDRANLSTSQVAEIQAYLFKQSSSNQSIFSRYPNRTKLLTKILSKYFNLSRDSEEVLFSEDDLQAYIEGRANLSLIQEAQIQTHLAKQSSSPYGLFSKYSTSTKRPRRISIPGRGIQPEDQWKGNLSLTEADQMEDYSEELPPTDLTSYNRTIDIDELPFSEDDLRAYLEDRANLSTSQVAEIQAHLFKQSSFNQSIFSRYPNRTKLLTKILSKYFNFSTDSEEVLFSEDDLQAYIEGRANLTLAQEAQIQAYLAKQTLLGNNMFSRYWASTIKPTKIPTFDDKLKGYSEEQTNLLQSDHSHSSESASQKLTSMKPYSTRRRTGGKQPIQSVPNGTDDFDASMEQASDIYTDSNEDNNTSDISDEYSQLSRATSSISHLHTSLPSKLTRPPFIDQDGKYIDDDDDTQESFDMVSTPLKDARVTIPSDQQSQDISNANLLSSTLSSNDLLILKDYSPSTDTLHSDDYDQSITVRDDDDDEKINPSRFSTKSRSTIHPRFTQITPQQPLPTYMGSIPFDKTSKPALSYPFATDVDHTSSDSVVISHDNTTNMPSLSIGADLSKTRIDVNQTEIFPPKTNGTIMPSIHQRNTSFQNQSHFTDTSGSYDDVDNNNNLENEISHKYSSPLSVAVNVSSTLDPLSPFAISNTTLSSSRRRSRSSTPLHHSLVSLSTKSPKLTRPSASKFFSEPANTTSSSEEIISMESETTSMESETTSMESKPTTVLSYSTIFPLSTSKQQSSHKFSSMQTTDIAITSNIPKEKSITTLSDLSSTPFPFTTDHLRSKSSMSSKSLLNPNEQLFTTKSEQYKSKPSKTRIETSSLPYAQSTRISSTLFPSTNLDFSSTKLSDKTSSRSTITTVDEKHLALETTDILPSTSFPHTSKSKTLSTLEDTTFDRIYPSTTSTSTATTTRRLRTGKQKVTRWQTQELPSTATIVPSYLTTTIHDHQITTTGEISTHNDSSTYLTNDLLNKMFNNISTSTNSSGEKSLFFNLSNLPPSSWNLSLNSNESISLDIALPSSSNSSYFNTTTNLTFTNIEANRFSTNIIGIPVNLHIDRVQTKQFSLTMNATDNNINRNSSIQHSSDVIIGHVKSEEFQLNLTKSDNMHVHVQQVDSATADLYFDSNFCTNQSSLDINLNLSKNGTIRYGNRKPIQIGPVFTRVHMLKQSCDSEQPLALFFDICERENPCLNGGTCLSILPDYENKLFIPTETGHVGYKCQCSLHASGEHCQSLEYPLGYCLNGGTLFQILDRFNRSIEQCICPRGFRGEHCEENIDNCIGIDCSDHGVCEDGIDTYKCSCFDGFFGFHCERTNVQTVLLQAASRSFGVIAILLIAGIGSLVVISDIHTYLTRKQERNDLLTKIPRVTSELFENSVLLLGFSDAPIEMNDLSNVGTKKKPVILKQRQTRRTIRSRRHVSYRQMASRRTLTTFPKSSSRRYLVPG